MNTKLERATSRPALPDSFQGEFVEQLTHLQSMYPDIYGCIDSARLSEENGERLTSLASRAFDFGPRSEGGRGELYRKAQLNPLVRIVGIRQLFQLVSHNQERGTLSPAYRILDVLGGDGVLARAINHVLDLSSRPTIVTSDISESMISAARRYGLFAIRQAAQNLVFKDGCVDGVIIAYGTHHIPVDQRLDACKEAFRVLKPGGRIAFHDFETGSPVSLWFRDVVDPYSLTGHRFPHFTREEIHDLLASAGFTDIRVDHLYDPFKVSGESEEQVKSNLAEYLMNMYGLAKLVDEHGYDKALEITYALSRTHFKYDYSCNRSKYSFGTLQKETPKESEIRAAKAEKGWQIEAPRIALVGSATKPLPEI